MNPGARLGPYEILAPLGSGGMGVVYRARDARLGRDVAIKLLPAELSHSDEARERLRREARAAAALQHPNICAIYDVGDENGQLFLVLELLSGETLQQRLQRGSLPVGEAVDIVIAVAGALTVAHAAGIIHRDIKPANIFLTDHGPKILDFGLAKASASITPDAATVPLLTQQGHIVGTAAYMSPEQLEGLPLDGRTDVYSLGVTLSEMITGSRTFVAGRDAAIDPCIVRAIERSRELRFQTAADFKSALLHARGSSVTAVAVPAPAARPWLPIIAACIVLAIVAIGSARWFYSRPSPRTLTDRDTIVIADFRNTTGDTVFDEALRQGLEVQLQQSPFLTVIPDSRMRQTLSLMARPSGAPLTGQVAAEVCQRTGSTAYLEGSIAPLGSRYAVGLKATGCANDDVIDDAQVQIDRKEDVLKAVGELATRFRERVGESLASRQQFAKPLPEATTASLEALKAYSTGRRINDTQGPAAAIPLFRRAVDIDPQFAVAWAILGLNDSILGDSPAAIEATTKAYQLRDRTTDRERFLIESLYARQVTGDLDTARQTFENYCNTYPRELDAHGLLSGFATNGTGRYEEAIEHADIAVTLDPLYLYGHMNGVMALFYLDRTDDAKRRLQRALDSKVRVPDEVFWQYRIADVQGDRAALADAVTRGAASPATAAEMALLESQRAARERRWDDARASIQRAITLARGAGHPESVAIYQGLGAIWEALGGHVAQARHAADEALELSSSRDVSYAAAFALARINDRVRAAKLTASLAERFPEDTSVRFSYLPTLRALDALAAHDATKAVTILEEARPYETAIPAVAFQNYMGWAYPMFVRAEALETLGHKDDAIAELRRILSHRGLLQTDPIANNVEQKLAALTGPHAK